MIKYIWKYHDHDITGKDVHRQEEGTATLRDGHLIDKNGKPFDGFKNMKVSQSDDHTLIFRLHGFDFTLAQGASLVLKNQYTCDAQDVGTWRKEDFELTLQWE